MGRRTITISRGPVLTLWASVVARRLGFARDEALTLGREFEQALDRALDELPVEWRAAVVLRDIEGLTTEEAAEIAGIGQPAFKSRLHRGRMQLRALLEPYLQLEKGG